MPLHKGTPEHLDSAFSEKMLKLTMHFGKKKKKRGASFECKHSGEWFTSCPHIPALPANVGACSPASSEETSLRSRSDCLPFPSFKNRQEAVVSLLYPFSLAQGGQGCKRDPAWTAAVFLLSGSASPTGSPASLQPHPFLFPPL